MNDRGFRFRDQSGSDLAPSPPRIEVDGPRDHRCYEIAGLSVLAHREWSLVHGRAFDVGHAWLELNGWVYDPIFDALMTREQYKGFASASAEHTYSAQELAEHLKASDHWGPWEGDSMKAGHVLDGGGGE